MPLGKSKTQACRAFRRHDAVQLLSCVQSCAPTNWWSAEALDGLMTGGGGVGGVRPDERANMLAICSAVCLIMHVLASYINISMSLGL